ncbi:hypothetical protein GCM10027176_55240 [Actinoallomurus bryophytorum]|uniref:Uncharacterized protein n=1 Tax=Actinoallomurus bryophytorum TaxID=1490222 RepID=A0A543C042_9ACTN|nr:hypothetical protein FB559_7739 [Actinoallomurus bryophytorum]
MRIRLQVISERVLEKVAPKATASAINCWQRECQVRSCLGQKTTMMDLDPCNDRQRVLWCGC